MADVFVAGRITQFVFLLLLAGLVMFFIQRARRGKVPKIRRLAALDALDEAASRAAEMGKPTVYSIGWGSQGLTNPTYAPMLLAGLGVLSYVAKCVAKRKGELIACIAHPETISLHEDIIRQAYLSEGALQYFKPESIRFLSHYQFAFAIGEMEVITREKVASNIMIGSFAAESLLFAETGSAMGCFQVGGTAQVTQLPFFVGLCDYTLLGEDIYAADAYVSQDPTLIGGIAGQDLSKFIAIALIVLGVALATLGTSVLTGLLKM